jgi:hypothetical protein
MANKELPFNTSEPTARGEDVWNKSLANPDFKAALDEGMADVAAGVTVILPKDASGGHVWSTLSADSSFMAGLERARAAERSGDVLPLEEAFPKLKGRINEIEALNSADPIPGLPS